MKNKRDLFTNETLKNECVAVNGSRVQFDELGRAKASPRISNIGYLKTDKLGYLQIQSQKLLGGRFKSTKTKTVIAPCFFYIVAKNVKKEYIVDMIFKRLFYIVSHNGEESATMMSVNFCDFASFGKRWQDYADANGIKYDILMVDNVKQKTFVVDKVTGNPQHELSDMRNSHRTWATACHTNN